MNANAMKHEDYTVGWICALPIEMAAASCVLDERHNALRQAPGDENNYTLGRVGPHNVAIAGLPNGVIGITSATRVAEQMRATFTSLRFGLMVGIGGGVPSDEHDIRLGDVVVSKPDNQKGGVVQYDYGKTVQEGRFVPTGSLNRPPDVLLNALTSLQAQHMYEESRMPAIISNVIARYPSRREACTYPGWEFDKLFDWDYKHISPELSCLQCNPAKIKPRTPRESSNPVIHYGLIASGNQVMRDGAAREKLRQELNVLCFEMEAAGLMDTFPCLVVRGVCDYADTHKNKQWQAYAAAMAAAYTKELLGVIPGAQISETPKAWNSTVRSVLAQNQHAHSASEQFLATQNQPELSPPAGRPHNAEDWTLNSSASVVGAAHPITTLPYDQDPLFVERRQSLKEIADLICKKHRRVSLSGLGGMGKSQIAIEYCYRFKKNHPEAHVFWIHAVNASRFQQGYIDIARRAEINISDTTVSDAFKRVSNWLSSAASGTWLLILDNADSEDLWLGPNQAVCGSADGSVDSVPLIRYLPQTSRGLMIMTTRNKRVGRGFSGWHCMIEIVKLTDEEARELLRHKIANDANWEDVPANELLKFLDNLPLAISQAAAYINDQEVDLIHYLALLRAGSSRDSLLERNYFDQRRDYETSNAVFVTWQVSLKEIERQSPRATEILCLMTFLDHHSVSRALLQGTDESQISFDSAIGLLKAFTLVQEQKDRNAYALHSLIRDCLSRWLETEDSLQRWQEQALTVVYDHCPSHEGFRHWKKWQELMPHIDIVLLYRLTKKFLLVRRGSILTGVTKYARKRGNFETAFKRGKEAVKLLEASLGRREPETLDAMEALTRVLKSCKNYHEAEKLARQVLNLRLETLGDRHQDTLRTMDRLVKVLNIEKKYQESEALSRLIFKTRMDTLGADHEDTISSMLGIAVTLASVGKNAESEIILRKALQTSKTALGEANSCSIEILNGLGMTLFNQGKYEEALMVYTTASGLLEQTQGKENPDFLSTCNDIGLVQYVLGNFAESYDALQKALEGRRTILGEEHPLTKKSLKNLNLTQKESQKGLGCAETRPENNEDPSSGGTAKVEAKSVV